MRGRRKGEPPGSLLGCPNLSSFPLRGDDMTKRELKVIAAIQMTKTVNDPETKQREIRGLVEAMQTYQLSSGLILTMDEEGNEEIITEGQKMQIKIMPTWKWLLMSVYRSESDH